MHGIKCALNYCILHTFILLTPYNFTCIYALLTAVLKFSTNHVFSSDILIIFFNFYHVLIALFLTIIHQSLSAYTTTNVTRKQKHVRFKISKIDVTVLTYNYNPNLYPMLVNSKKPHALS